MIYKKTKSLADTKKGIAPCKFEIGFNALGMPFFECLVHGKGEDRIDIICCRRLKKKLEKKLLK